MADANRLVRIGFPPEQARILAEEIGGGPVSADDVTVGEITAAEFTFAGGTLTEFCQAIADAIPAA